MQPKFISQTQIDIPFKCLESLVFGTNNGWLIENHGLGTLKAYVSEEILNWHSLSLSQRKTVQSSALRLRLYD